MEGTVGVLVVLLCLCFTAVGYAAQQDGLRIPRILHRNYMAGAAALQAATAGAQPSFRAHWLGSCTAHNPGWQEVVWDEPAVLDLIQSDFPWFLRTYLSYPRLVQRSDVMRYMVLYKFGGVYLDADVECFANMEQSLAGRDLVLNCENPGPWGQLHNAAMASTAGHPFWLAVLQEAMRRSRAAAAENSSWGMLQLKKLWWASPFHDKIHDVLQSTGPKLLSDVYETYTSGAPACGYSATTTSGSISTAYPVGSWFTPCLCGDEECERHWKVQHFKLVEQQQQQQQQEGVQLLSKWLRNKTHEGQRKQRRQQRQWQQRRQQQRPGAVSVQQLAPHELQVVGIHHYSASWTGWDQSHRQRQRQQMQQEMSKHVLDYFISSRNFLQQQVDSPTDPNSAVQMQQTGSTVNSSSSSSRDAPIHAAAATQSQQPAGPGTAAVGEAEVAAVAPAVGELLGAAAGGPCNVITVLQQRTNGLISSTAAAAGAAVVSAPAADQEAGEGAAEKTCSSGSSRSSGVPCKRGTAAAGWGACGMGTANSSIASGNASSSNTSSSGSYQGSLPRDLPAAAAAAASEPSVVDLQAQMQVGQWLQQQQGCDLTFVTPHATSPAAFHLAQQVSGAAEHVPGLLQVSSCDTGTNSSSSSSTSGQCNAGQAPVTLQELLPGSGDGSGGARHVLHFACGGCEAELLQQLAVQPWSRESPLDSVSALLIDVTLPKSTFVACDSSSSSSSRSSMTCSGSSGGITCSSSGGSTCQTTRATQHAGSSTSSSSGSSSNNSSSHECAGLPRLDVLFKLLHQQLGFRGFWRQQLGDSVLRLGWVRGPTAVHAKMQPADAPHAAAALQAAAAGTPRAELRLAACDCCSACCWGSSSGLRWGGLLHHSCPLWQRVACHVLGSSRFSRRCPVVVPSERQESARAAVAAAGGSICSGGRACSDSDSDGCGGMGAASSTSCCACGSPLWELLAGGVVHKPMQDSASSSSGSSSNRQGAADSLQALLTTCAAGIVTGLLLLLAHSWYKAAQAARALRAKEARLLQS